MDKNKKYVWSKVTKIIKHKKENNILKVKIVNSDICQVTENHSLIDENTLKTIRTTGNASDNPPDRTEVMKTHGLPYDRKAENVIITGCMILGQMPKVFGEFAGILDQGRISYTFLSKEYCCGNILYRPAI